MFSPFTVFVHSIEIVTDARQKALQQLSLPLPLGVLLLGRFALACALFGLIALVKSYEILTAEAAVTGDREIAYQALLAHPLGPADDKVQEVLDDMLETHREYLPQFWD